MSHRDFTNKGGFIIIKWQRNQQKQLNQNLLKK